MLSTHALPSARCVPVAVKTVCRLCGATLYRTLIDFGHLVLANRTVAPDAAEDQPYRLHVRICDGCTLVQVADAASPKTIAAPFPSLSSPFVSGMKRARRYAETMQKRLRLTADSLVIEVGSNDGHLLRHFRAAAIPVLGIEPAPHAAAAAIAAGIPTESVLFDTETAMDIAVRHGRADLLIANNVLPHVPDLFDFAAGLASILRPAGVISLRVPHLLSLLQNAQFDAFRHDAYTYLSLRVLERVLRSVGLRVFDAERAADHGGSLVVHACHADGTHVARPGLKAVRLAESLAELDRRDLYSGFSGRVTAARDEILNFLRTRAAAGRHVAAYGVSTRGATLLNCCGITTREIACVADLDPAGDGQSLPGSRIPIVPLEALLRRPPDDVMILSWPDAAEIAALLQPLRQHGTQLWTAVPRISRV